MTASQFPHESPVGMNEEECQLIASPVAVLEHLTGPSRGTATWVGERKLYVVLRHGRLLDVSTTEPGSADGEIVARLHRYDGTYEIEAAGPRQIWVNGHPVSRQRLENHDTIEFGELGPISRFYLYQSGQLQQASVVDILSDAIAYLRSSRKPLSRRSAQATLQVVRRLMRETTLLFRVGVIAALVGFGVIAFQQSRINALLRQEIESGAAQLETFSRLLAKVREDSLSVAELAKLREDFARGMTTATERLSRLEQFSTATKRVIARSRSSILFLQGAYAFRDRSTGRMLRHVVDADGRSITLPHGLPLLTLEGNGPVAERQFTGTGFLLGNDGSIVTSKHVAQPWLSDAKFTEVADGTLEPEPLKFIAYLSDGSEPFDVALLRASENSDLAILRSKKALPDVRGLELAERLVESGEEVVLLGFPTGMRSMLAQAGPDFIKKLQEDEVTDTWKVAERLAAARRITPLASRGIVGRASEEAIVYDAQTTHGGSGGPVLDVYGGVVAVNSAILPEYGGSNLGVPATELRRFLTKLEAP